MSDTTDPNYAEMLFHIHQELAALRTSVNVLKVLEAMRLNPAEPLKALESLRQLEEKQANLDPNAQIVKQAAEVIDAIKKAQKLGGPKDA